MINSDLSICFTYKNPLGGCRGDFLLIVYLNEYEDGKNDADKGVNADCRAEDRENNSDEGDSGEKADNEAANNVNKNGDHEGDDKRLKVVCLKSAGEELLKCFHFIYSP